MKWTEEKLRLKISAAIREELRAEGLDPDVRPTHKWLRQHGYGGIEGYARRNDMSVREVLENLCGFKPRPRKPLGIDHAETRRLVEEWLEVEKNVHHQWSDRRIEDARTHFRSLAEIASDELGSTNLLRILRDDSEIHVKHLYRLFSGIAARLESQGGQSNYTRSLERWADYLVLLDEIDDHKIDKIRDMMGYKYDRRSPEHKLTPKQIRKCWQTTETLEEKALMILLVAGGLRRSEPTDLHVGQLRLDREDPYILFDDSRKTGPGTVALMAGSGVLGSWIEHLEELDHWNGKWLFPSKKSSDGSRSGQWVNRVIERLVEDAEISFPDGTEPTPKSFRSFWYEHYSSARQEWLSHIERLAEEQGVSSAKIIDYHYLNGKEERDHFRKFAQSYFAAVFGDELVIGTEDVAEARDPQTDEERQTALGDYVDQIYDGLTADKNESTYESPAAIEPISTWIRTRLRKEHAAAAASLKFEHYPPSPKRAAGLVTALGAWAVVSGTVFGLTGTFIVNPLSGEITAEPGAIIGIAMLLLLLIDQTPDLDPPQR